MTYRIAMVGACPYPAPQGSQVLLQDTALALQARGHEVHLVVYAYGVAPDDTGLSIHRAAPVPGARRIAAGPSPLKPLLDLALLKTLRRVIRQKQIDLVHAHNYEALIVALAARKRPIIYHAHNLMRDELPYFIPQSGAFGGWLDRTFPRRADGVIAPHARLASALMRDGCDPKRIAVIPPPIDVHAFTSGEVSEECPPVIYTGNLDPYQNLPLLMRAMERVQKRLPQARLIVASAQKPAFKRAESILTPDFETLRRVLARDAVVACPRVSWSGYPIKLLNAMAAGKAVVACESAAPPIVHEHNGLLVPDNDEAAFADALVRLLQDHTLRRTLGQAARQTVIEQHASAAIAARIEEAYANALEWLRNGRPR